MPGNPGRAAKRSRKRSGNADQPSTSKRVVLLSDDDDEEYADAPSSPCTSDEDEEYLPDGEPNEATAQIPRELAVDSEGLLDDDEYQQVFGDLLPRQADRRSEPLASAAEVLACGAMVEETIINAMAGWAMRKGLTNSVEKLRKKHRRATNILAVTVGVLHEDLDAASDGEASDAEGGDENNDAEQDVIVNRLPLKETEPCSACQDLRSELGFSSVHCITDLPGIKHALDLRLLTMQIETARKRPPFPKSELRDASINRLRRFFIKDCTEDGRSYGQLPSCVMTLVDKAFPIDCV